jgi:endonuclease-3
MFELSERGHRTLFEQLVACIISIRTRDEVSLPTALRLLERAPTPESIRTIARRTVDEFGGKLPRDRDVLMSFKGVGPKCANLALGVAHGESHISVDIHAHRVTNRWGVVHTATPEQTMVALERVLPKRYWVEINRLLVPFGKHVCTGRLPKCSTCPVLEYCRQVGVTSHR